MHSRATYGTGEHSITQLDFQFQNEAFQSMKAVP